jgi:Flp pilus assembly protein TadG
MKKWDNSRQGLAAVEFALMLPALALLLLLLVEGANAMHAYSTLVEASREGARYVLMDGDTASVETLIGALVAELNTEDLSTNVATDPIAKTVTVEVSYAYQPFGSESAGGMFNDGKPFQLVAQTTMPLP